MSLTNPPTLTSPVEICAQTRRKFVFRKQRRRRWRRRITAARSPSAYLGRCQTNLEQAAPRCCFGIRGMRFVIIAVVVAVLQTRKREEKSLKFLLFSCHPRVLRINPPSSILRALPYFGVHWIDSVLAARHKGPPRSLRARFCCSLNTARRRSLLSSRGSRPWP